MGLGAATSLKDNFPLISFPSQKGLNNTRGDLPPRAVKVIKKIPRLTSHRKTNWGCGVRGGGGGGESETEWLEKAQSEA